METSIGIVQIGDRYFMATAVIEGASVSEETIERVKDRALALTQTLVEAHKEARPNLADRQITMINSRGFHENADLIADHNFDLSIDARKVANTQLGDFTGTRGNDLYDRIQGLFFDTTPRDGRGVHVYDEQESAAAASPESPRSLAADNASPFSLRFSHPSKAELRRLAEKAEKNNDIGLCIRVYDTAKRAGFSFSKETQENVEAERRKLNSSGNSHTSTTI